MAFLEGKAQKDIFLSVVTPAFAINMPAKRVARWCKPAKEVSRFAKFQRIARLWKIPPSPQTGPQIPRIETDQAQLADYVEIIEETDHELHKHIWDAVISLMSFLCHTDRPLGGPKTMNDQAVVLELGAGMVLLSMYLRKWISYTAESRYAKLGGCCIFATDLRTYLISVGSEVSHLALIAAAPLSTADALELIRDNQRINFQQAGDSLSVIPLDWFATELPQIVRRSLLISSDETPAQSKNSTNRPQAVSKRRRLLVVAFDCSYNPDLYDAFASLL